MSTVKGPGESEVSQKKLRELWEKNFSLLDAIVTNNNEAVKSLLNNGSNPNATCPKTYVSACHIAAFSNEAALQLLLEAGAETKRFDINGNTPLHYAALTNSPKKIAMILNFPEDFINEMELTKDEPYLTKEQETKINNIRVLINKLNDLVDATRVGVEPLKNEWKAKRDSRDFGNKFIFLSLKTEPGWSALHAASAYAFPKCAHLLLAAQGGANANLHDQTNSTPLDVAGVSSSDIDVQSYLETIDLLREYKGSLYSHENLTSVLERSLRKGSVRALRLLLDAAAPIRERHPKAIEQIFRLRLKDQLSDLMKKRPGEMAQEGSEMLLSAASKSYSDEVSIALFMMADSTYKNSMGVSVIQCALHLAAKNGNYDIVKTILDHDTKRECDLSAKNNENYSPFLYAIVSGKAEIVRLMLDRNSNLRDNLNSEVEGLTPLWYAAKNKLEELFKLILEEQIKMKSMDNQTFQDVLLEIFLNDVYKNEMELVVKAIAKHNYSELFCMLKEHDDVSLKFIKLCKEYAFYEAIKHNSRKMIMALIDCGADLSKINEDGQTAISLIMYHVTNPTEFMTEVLDKCIDIDKNVDNQDCVITIKYDVLMAIDENKESDDVSDQLTTKANKESDGVSDHLNTKANKESDGVSDHLNTKTNKKKEEKKNNDMKVLEALIETGDLYDQRSLLTHPVVESFLYLKLKKSTILIYILIMIHISFLIFLNVYIATFYYLLDQTKIYYYFIINWIFYILAIVTFGLCFIVDLYYLIIRSYNIKVEKRCSIQMNRIAPCPGSCSAGCDWMKEVIKGKTIAVFKFIIFFLFVASGVFMLFNQFKPMEALGNYRLVRVVAATAVFLSWKYFIDLLSWIPKKECYNIIRMYGQVFCNVIKVMLAFLFPLVSFSICFTILLHSKEPFDDPISAFFKTMVMMSSEFEYEKNVNNGSGNELRIFFMLFFICISIVLMNLMLSFAVRDYQELSDNGNQRRLKKQVEILSRLEQVFQMWPFSTWKWTEMKVDKEKKIQPTSKDVDAEIMKNILKKVQILKETKENKADYVHMKAKINDTFELTKKILKILDSLQFESCCTKR